jgi:recombination protein RecA
MSNDTKRDFDFALFDSEVRKQYGDEAVKALDGGTKFGEEGTYIPSSSEALNRAIGIGGIPRGRVIEIFGPESSGKTTLALDFCASAQRMNVNGNGFVFYQDSENALNPEYAERLGVNLSKEKFRMSQTNELEEAMNLTLKAAKFGAAVIVIDSIPTLEYEKTLDAEEATGDRAGGIAKPLKAALKKIVKVCRETQSTVILINHITYKIGTAAMYGNPETTPGGGGPRYYCSVRLDVRTASGEQRVDKTTGEVWGTGTRVKVVKNKVASPFKKAEFDIVYGQGIDKIKDLCSVAPEVGLIQKSGNWYYVGEAKFNGMSALTEALRTDPKLEAKLRQDLQAAMRA